jgi:hypothetical protein
VPFPFVLHAGAVVALADSRFLVASLLGMTKRMLLGMNKRTLLGMTGGCFPE